jgi:hypothetical protein
MRIAMLLPLAALAAGCQVTEDGQNDQVTIQYNQDLAENAAADIANGAQEAGEAIANGAEEAVDAARNVDVAVKVDTNKADNEKPANSN